MTQLGAPDGDHPLNLHVGYYLAYLELQFGWLPVNISEDITLHRLGVFCAPIRTGSVRELGGAHHYRLR